MLTYGFYNSVNRDRRYDAEQIGAMFDGLITDGIFANYKSALRVTAGSGRRELIINPGKAWFNGTWTTVDDGGHHIYLLGSAVEATYFIYLTVNKADRVNTIAGYTYERLSDPGKNIYYYLLAQVTIPGGADEIQQSMIVDTRGSDLCPYVTGILETVSFEEVVKEVCGDNWQMWLDEYSEGINATVSKAAENASTALALARRTDANAIESNDRVYTWAQYETIPTGAASYSFERALDDLTRDAPPQRKLFWAPSFDGNTLTLIKPMQKLPLSAKGQLENWRRYPYFYGDGGDGTTDNTVYRYDELSVTYDGGVANPVGIYTIKTSKAVVDPAPVVAGDYIGTVVADSPFAYPKNGPSGNYWYIRFSARAEDIFFDDSELSLYARTVQEAIEALSKAGGPGNGSDGGSADHYPDWSRFKLYVMGDSLTDPAGSVHTSKFYYEYIAEKTGIQVVVDGLGGTGYHAGVSTSRRFADRVSNIPEDVSVVILFGSGNDVKNATFDEYKAGMAAAMGYFFNNRPGLPVIIVPPSPWATYGKRSEEWKTYCDTLELLALNYSLHYVREMWTAPPFDPNSAADRAAFFTKCPDGIHPDENGHRLLAPYFYNALAKVLSFKE